MSIVDLSRTDSLIEELIKVLENEVELFSDFSLLLSQLNVSVKGKQWSSLEKLINQLNDLGNNIVTTEQVRNDRYLLLKDKLGVKDETILSDALLRTNLKLRHKYILATKKLRMEVFKVKVASRSLGYYLQSVSYFIQQVLEEIFPHSKGKIYSSSGKETRKGTEALMINKEL